MFTGIVEEVGEIASFAGADIVVRAHTVLDGVKLGDSICVNGACLTVVAFDADSFTVNVVPETLRRTSLWALKPGSRVNLERAMPADGRFGGHMVQGHVEGTAELISITPDGPEDILVRYRVSPQVGRYIVTKGFIAVDGASLTVVDCTDTEFTVALVPFTRQHTNLTRGGEGSLVNIETDIMARYIERLLRPE